MTIWFPRRINGRWYRPGSKVFRADVFSPGGHSYHYGDEFDVLKGNIIER